MRPPAPSTVSGTSWFIVCLSWVVSSLPPLTLRTSGQLSHCSNPVLGPVLCPGDLEMAPPALGKHGRDQTWDACANGRMHRGGLRAHGETLTSWGQAAEDEKTLTSQAAAGGLVGGEAGRGGVV